MNVEELIISIVRIAGSVPVLFFPFWGSILAILVDLSDLFMMGYINLGGVSNYQELDKFLDLFYMSLFLMVSLRWNSREKFISISLFIFRMVGVVLFFIFDMRIILVFFPNIFDFSNDFTQYLPQLTDVTLPPSPRDFMSYLGDDQPI